MARSRVLGGIWRAKDGAIGARDPGPGEGRNRPGIAPAVGGPRRIAHSFSLWTGLETFDEKLTVQWRWKRALLASRLDMQYTRNADEFVGVKGGTV